MADVLATLACDANVRAALSRLGGARPALAHALRLPSSVPAMAAIVTLASNVAADVCGARKLLGIPHFAETLQALVCAPRFDVHDRCALQLSA